MGRKPALTMAGTLLTSLALAGCQSSSSARPSTQFNPPSGNMVSQNSQNGQTPNRSVTNTTGGGTVTYGQPGQGLPTAQASGGFTQSSTNGQSASVNGGFSTNSTPGQSGSPYTPSSQPGRMPTTTGSSVVIPPSPTPASAGQLPTSPSQPLPAVAGSLNTSGSVQLPGGGGSVSATSNLMPVGGPSIGMSPPPIGAMGPVGSPIAASSSMSLNTSVDLPGPPQRTTTYPNVPSNNGSIIGNGTVQGFPGGPVQN
jgi:hypothetical protein